MAVLKNTIGDHEFIALQGSPSPPVEWPAKPVQRLGVDGTAFWRVGKRGRPFKLRSQVDCEDLDDAHAEFQLYLASILIDPLVLVVDDYDYDAEDDNWKVVVLDVRQVTLHKTLVAQGGLADPSAAWLEADWDLIAFENVEEE